MAVDISKPLKARYVIEGVTDQIELQMAGDILMKIYNIMCDIVNNGGIQKFNEEWDRLHPNWVYNDELDDDDPYYRAYERYIKSVADKISEASRYKGTTYKLREHEPVLLNFNEGYFVMYGYKEKL